MRSSTTTTIAPTPGSGSTPRRGPGRLVPLRPLAILGVAMLVAAGSYGIRLASGGGSSATTRPAATAVPGLTGAIGAGAAAAPRVAPPDPLGAAGAIGETDAAPESADLQRLTQASAVWAANLQRDPSDFVSADNLALDLYSRGRLTGSADDYAAAQTATDQALTAYPQDVSAQTMRALLLYTTHDFITARSDAQAIYDADHTQLQALATAADSALELGDYAAATKTYGDLQRLQPGAAITARLARLASLQGDDAKAATLAAEATKQAKAEGSVGTGLAFYPYFQGYLAFQGGRLQDAVAADDAALKAWPGSYLAHEALAKAKAALGDLDGAITEYQHAIAIVPQPEFLAGLGDLYAIQGKQQLADQQYATVRAIAGLQARLYNRQLVLFDVNHGVNLAEALTLASNELAVRKDVYGWDADAWALLANGRAAEADAAMQHALGQGTNDALLDYHAGMIANAVGDSARAHDLLSAALALNPGFDPLQAMRARATLATLAGG